MSIYEWTQFVRIERAAKQKVKRHILLLTLKHVDRIPQPLNPNPPQFCFTQLTRNRVNWQIGYVINVYTMQALIIINAQTTRVTQRHTHM